MGLPLELLHKILEYAVRGPEDLIKVRNISNDWREAVKTSSLWLEIDLLMAANIRIISLLRNQYSHRVYDIVKKHPSEEALTYNIKVRNSLVVEQFTRLKSFASRSETRHGATSFTTTFTSASASGGEQGIVTTGVAANTSSTTSTSSSSTPSFFVNRSPLTANSVGFLQHQHLHDNDCNALTSIESPLRPILPQALALQEYSLILSSIAIINDEFMKDFRLFIRLWHVYEEWFPTIYGVSKIFKQKLFFCNNKTLFTLYLIVTIACASIFSFDIGQNLKEKSKPVGSLTALPVFVLIIANILFFIQWLLVMTADELLSFNIIWLVRSWSNKNMLVFSTALVSVILLLVGALISLIFFYVLPKPAADNDGISSSNKAFSEFRYVVFSLPLYLAWIVACYISQKLTSLGRSTVKFTNSGTQDEYLIDVRVCIFIKVLHFLLCSSFTLFAAWIQINLQNSDVSGGHHFSIFYVLIPFSVIIILPSLLSLTWLYSSIQACYLEINRIIDGPFDRRDVSYKCKIVIRAFFVTASLLGTVASVLVILKNIELCVVSVCNAAQVVTIQVLLFTILAIFTFIVSFGAHKLS